MPLPRPPVIFNSSVERARMLSKLSLDEENAPEESRSSILIAILFYLIFNIRRKNLSNKY